MTNTSPTASRTEDADGVSKTPLWNADDATDAPGRAVSSSSSSTNALIVIWRAAARSPIDARVGFDCIPDKLTLSVLFELAADQLCRLRRVCRKWARLCDDESLWKEIFRRASQGAELPTCGSFRDAYLSQFGRSLATVQHDIETSALLRCMQLARACACARAHVRACARACVCTCACVRA